MPRPTAVALLLALSVSSGPLRAETPSASAAAAAKCEGEPEGDGAAGARDLRRTAESGALFRFATARLGPAISCRFDRAGQALRLRFRYPNGGQLDARIDPSIEASEVRLEMAGIPERRARSLLREAERDVYGREGCGIDWKHATHPAGPAGRRIDAYDGDRCNCRGTVEHRGGRVVAIALRSAC
jgi:hypothetical protein